MASYRKPSAFDIEYAARTAWGEARSEGQIGMACILWVGRNRLLSSANWWNREKGDGVTDDTFAATFLDPYQFSCWNGVTIRKGDDKNVTTKALLEAGVKSWYDKNLQAVLNVDERDIQFRQATALAKDITSETPTTKDYTGGSTHYYVIGTPTPDWAKGREPNFEYGHHAFFKLS